MGKGGLQPRSNLHFDRLGEQVEVLLMGNLLRTEPRGVLVEDLGIEQNITICSKFAHQSAEAYLAGIGAATFWPAEHTFSAECSADGQTIDSAHWFIIAVLTGEPCLDTVGVVRFMHEIKDRDDLIAQPAPTSPLSATGSYDATEGRIGGQFKGLGCDGFA